MDKRKIYGTILGGMAFIAVIIAVTYARYVWRSTDTDLSFSISDSYFYCESGMESQISSLAPVLDYRSTSAISSFSVKNIGRNDTTFSISLNISSIDESLKSESLKYKILLDSSGGSKNCSSTSEEGCTTIAEGDFSDAIVGINTLAETVTLPNNSKYEYYLFIYIDGNMANDPVMQNSSMSYTLDVCEVVVFFDYNGGYGDKSFLKVTDKYIGLPVAAKDNTVINFDSNGGSGADSQTISYTFGGWYKESTFTNKVNEGSTVTLTTNHTLHAKWNMTDSSGSNTSDGCITLPTPTKLGYTFGGWYKEAGLTTLAGNGGSSYCVSRDSDGGDVTLYAKWTPITYYLNYNLNGGTKGSGSPSSAKYGANVTIGNPTKTFTISGNANGTGATISSAVIGRYKAPGWTGANLNTNTALYGPDLNNITNSWNGSKINANYFKNLSTTNGATVTMTAHWEDLTVTLPTATKTGYVCGWNTKADGSGNNYKSGGSYTAISNSTTLLLTLYAKCEPIKPDITYDYDINQAFSNGTYLDTDWKVNWDEDFEINTTVKVTSGGQRYLIFGSYDEVDSKALNLEVTADNKLRIFIGTTSSSLDVSSTSAIATNQNINVVFNWDASENAYSVTATGGITMNGTYDMSGVSTNNLRIGTVDFRNTDSPFGQITMSKFQIKTAKSYASTLSDLPDSPNRLAYLLDGWYTSSTGGTKVTTSAAVGENDVTYYARWIRQNYGVADTCQANSYSNYHTNLASAISGATAGQCITMLNNVTDTSDVAFSKNLELNTNGYTLSRTKSINVNEGVTLTTSGSGTITNSTASVDTMLVYGNLNATNGTIHSEAYCTIGNMGSGTVTISGATISNKDTTTFSVIYTNDVEDTGSTVVLSSGIIKGYRGIAVYRNGNFNMSGGYIFGTGDSSVIVTTGSTGTVNITGGTIGNSVYDFSGIYHGGSGSVTISGGTIAAGSHGIVSVDSSSFMITGGVIESINGYGVYNCASCTINLEASEPYNGSVTVVSKSKVAIYNEGIINYNEGVYSYSGLSNTVYNTETGVFNLNGGRHYHTADTSIFSGSGTINQPASWTRSYGPYTYNFVGSSNTLSLGYCTMKQTTITFNHRNNIASTTATSWTMQEGSWVASATSAAVYSNGGQFTGIRIPLTSDKKKNTTYQLSYYVKREVDFTGNFRGYVPTYDSSGNYISHNFDSTNSSVNTSNLPEGTWKMFKSVPFNSGDYATFPSVYLDFDTANQGPIYVDDVRVEEISTGTSTFGYTMPSITVPTRTGYKFKGYYTTDGAVDAVSTVSKPVADVRRIDLASSNNGWAYTTAGDVGTHIQAKIVVTNPASVPILDFNDIFLTSAQYRVTNSGTTYTIYADFDITTDMVTSRNNTNYATGYRFIDVNGLNDSSSVSVHLLTKGGKKYYDETGASVWDCDETDNLTLYAHWEQTTFQIAFHPNGGSLSATTGFSMTSQGLLYKDFTVTDSTYGSLPTPTRTGYKFGAWFAKKGLGNITLAASDANYNFKNVLGGVFPGSTFKITMDSASVTSGSASHFRTVIYDFTSSVPLAEVDVAFGNNISYTITCPDGADKNHDIGLLIYSGVAGQTANIATSYTNVALNTTDFTGTGTIVSDTSIATPRTHMFFASWTEDSYTISYMPNGGTGTMGSQTVSSGSSVTISANAYSKAGHTFLGWTTNADGTDDGHNWTGWSGTWAYKNGQYGIANNKLILYARWQVNTYPVTYNANGGSGAPGAQTKTYGTNLTLSTTIPTRSGYAFLGWSTSSTGSVQYNAGGTYTGNAALNLYAIWVEKNYGVHNSCGGNSGAYSSYYSTLANAVSGATAGQCITLLKDYWDSSAVTFTKNVYLSTNGYTLSKGNIMTVNPGVTVTKVGTGSIVNTASYVFSVYGHLNLSAGNITSYGNAVVNYGTGTVTVSGATVTNDTASGNGVFANSSSAPNAANFSVTSGVVTGYMAFSLYGPSNLNVSGGHLYGQASTAVVFRDGHSGTMTMSGGTIGSTSFVKRAITVNGSTSITMTGGTLTSGGTATTLYHDSTGTVTLARGTVNGSGTVIHVVDQGTLNLGETNNTGTLTVNGSGTGYANLICGENEVGSSSLCRVYKGVNITSTAGKALKVYSADFRMNSGAQINCTTTSNYYCIENKQTTYTTAACPQLGNSSSTPCYFGRVAIRQGYVQSVYASIYSAVRNDYGVYIGYRDDALYAYSHFGGTVDISKGPLIRASNATYGRGIYMDTVDSKWVFGNGVVGGAKSYGNEVPNVKRSGYSAKTTTASGYNYVYLG